MTFFESTTWFVICLLTAVASRAFDAYTSRDFEYYGLTEGNPLMADKYGYFSITKQVVAGVLIFAVGVIAFQYTTKAWIFYAVIAIPSVIIALINQQSKTKKRKVQIEYLRSLRSVDGTDDRALAGFFARVPLKTKGGRTRYVLFGWIYSEASDQRIAQPDLWHRIWDVSQKAEGDWFK
jgi:hypothetical protein